MKRTILAGAFSALAMTMAAPASAAVVIGVGFNGGAVTQVSTDGGTGSANYNTTTGGYFYNSSGTGIPLAPQPNLLTQSTNIQQLAATGGTLNLYVTQTNLAAFTGILNSIFTSNTIANATATISTYYSTTNQLFGGTLLQTTTFNGTNTFNAANFLSATAPWSTTVRYDIVFGSGTGNFNGTANLIGTAVPEPMTWAMMLIGFAGLGFAVRRNRNVTTRIRYA